MHVPRKLLALEASGRPISLALFENGRCLAERDKRSEVRHSADLLPMLDDLLKETEWSVNDLDTIAVTRGPGSFTSVRIALATARGLAYPAGIPVVALNSLEVLAAECLSVENPVVLAVLDARKNQVYAACYEYGKPSRVLLPPSCLDPEAVGNITSEPLTVVGSGVELVLPFVKATYTDADAFPRAGTLGRLMVDFIGAGRDFEPATPLYLRRSEAEEKRRNAREAL